MYDEDYYDRYEDDDYPIDGVGFAQEGSALRAATEDNPRNLPCPTCHWPNRLTPLDKARGYQCDSCADATERGLDINYYEGDEDAESDDDSGDNSSFQDEE